MRADNYGAGFRGAPEIVSSGPQVGQTLTGGHCRPHLGKPWLSAPQSEEGNRLFWGSPQTTLKFDESLEGLKRIQRNCYTDGLFQQKHTYKNCIPGNPLVVQWLGLCTFIAQAPILIPGRGTAILQAMCCSQREKVE